MDISQAHYLYPSTMFASRRPTMVSTILGSCVAICYWDRKLEFGGINHYMMPLWNGEGLASPRYGNIANTKLMQRMITLGSNSKNLIAKVFGGAEILLQNNDQFHIGSRNIQIALDMLEDANIPVIGKSVGGVSGRKIVFNTHSGLVKQSLILNMNC